MHKMCNRALKFSLSDQVGGGGGIAQADLGIHLTFTKIFFMVTQWLKSNIYIFQP